MPYPPAPWHMHGQLWLSLFRVRADVDALRPRGVYGVALVDYELPSPLTYSEILVARTVDKAVTITDIWVDSADSVAGGRELWAIPKELCEFEHTASRRGPLSSNHWAVAAHGTPVLQARFHDASRLAPRVGFKGSTWQPGLTEGLGAGQGDKAASLTGSARSLPARSHWEINPAGPLGWLAGRRPLATFRMADFSMSFG